MNAVRSMAAVGVPGPRAQRVVGVVRVNADDAQCRLDRLYALLEDWARWCGGFKPHLGYPRRVPGVVSGLSDMARGEDQRGRHECQRLGLVDAAVDDLPPMHRAAINQRYGVAAVFRFPRGNYVELLAEAHELLIVLLAKKTIDI
jgi:hypothetical protein